MALGMSTAARNARGAAITAEAGNAAKFQIYSGTRPATGVAIAAQVKLAEFVMGTPFATTTAGVTSITVPANATGLADGTATWARLTKADGTTFVMDLSAGTDFTLNTATVSIGLTMTVTGTPTITEGDA
jgi:hypothetical protein